PRGVQRLTNYDTLCRTTQLETQDERHNQAYDELDRMVAVQLGNRFGWGSAPRQGARFGQSTFRHTTRWLYDPLDRVLQTLFPNGETVSQVFDAEGNLIQRTDVHGKVTLYTYYNDNRLHTVTYEGLIFVYAYDLAGRLESITYPASTGIVANFTWNPNGQLLTLVYLQGGSPLQSFEYSYDDSGNRIQMIETPLNPLDAITWDYDYDWLDRLERVTRNGVLTSVYGYDESDNRISLDLPVTTEAWTYQVDLADQLQSRSVSIGGGPPTVAETFVSDPDGNMESRTAGAVTTDYVWNTLNQKVKRTVNGTPQERTSYDVEGVRRLEKDGTTSKYYSAGATSLADTRPSGPVSFLQGSMLLGVEAGGAISF
ncbi:RHS repeat protein, partial [bacterium]|nr:RHS repeat protein [bacterium]